MIQWRFILTRVIIVVAIVFLIRYALSPIARYVTVSTFEESMGGEVAVAKVHVGLFPPTLRYNDFKFYPSVSNEHAYTALTIDSAEFEIDGNAFLHRQYVVRDGRINGLKIVSKNGVKSHFDPQPETDRQIASDWFTQSASMVADVASKNTESLESESEFASRVEQTRRRWKSEYAVLTARAQELEATITKLGETTKGVVNPLRDWPRIEATIAKSKELQSELAGVREAIDEIPAQVQGEIIALETAKLAELRNVESEVIAPSTFTSMGSHLLSTAVNLQIDRLRACLDSSRRLADLGFTIPSEKRVRGEDINLLSQVRPAALLIERCAIDGQWNGGDANYSVTGIIENMTQSPEVREQPFRARLRLDGQETVRLEYVRDDSLAVPRESLVMHWPEVPAQSQSIGDANSTSIDLQGGRLELWAQVDVSGDVLQGRVVSRRVDTTLVVQSDAAQADSPLVSNLRKSLGTVDRVETDATFTGAWTDMAVTISSNLSQVLNSGLENAVAAETSAIRKQLASKATGAYETQLSELKAFLSNEHLLARESLAKADTTLQQFSEKVMNETRSAEVYLGRLRASDLK